VRCRKRECWVGRRRPGPLNAEILTEKKRSESESHQGLICHGLSSLFLSTWFQRSSEAMRQ